MLVRVIGATTPASSVIICAFMGGLGIGALLGAKFAQRKNFLSQLAIIEVLIFVCAIISSKLCTTDVLQQLIRFLNSTIGDGNPSAAIGFVLVFLLVLVPTSLMGATFPIIADFAAQYDAKGSATLLKLYAINSTGAVFGAFVSGFLLMPASGIEKTLMATGCCNLVSAILCLVASRVADQKNVSTFRDLKAEAETGTGTESDTGRAPERGKAEAEVNCIQAPAKSAPDPLVFLTLLVFATGAMSFAMEIVWTRFLVMIIGSSTYALSLMLTVFISGLASGAWVAEKIGEKTVNMLGSIAIMLAMASGAVTLNLYQYQVTPSTYLTMKKVTSTIGPSFWNETISMLLLAVFLIFLAATVIGTIFPLALGAVRGNNQKSDNKSVSLLYCSNIAGSMLGSFGCGVILLPVMSDLFISAIEQTTFLVSAGFIFFSMLALLITPKTITLRLDKTPSRFSVELKRVALICAVSMLALSLHPQWDSILLSSGLSYVSEQDAKTLSVPDLIDALRFKTKLTSGQSLLMYKEGTNSTISVISNPNANLVSLRSNGKVEAAMPLTRQLPAPDSDLPTQKLLGLLPAIMCSAPRELNGLVIGYGTGTTCSAVMTAPWVKAVTAVELEKAIWNARQYFQGHANHDDDESKLRKVTGDARNYLLLSDDTYDFIVSQPAEPWLSGASDLFTVEFYQLAKSRLRNTGMFCQWIPLYSLTANQLNCLLNTFNSVFPNVRVWHSSRAGELIVTGQIADGADSEEIRARFASPEMFKQFQQIGLESEVELNTNRITYPPQVSDPLLTTELNTDDNILIEGILARPMYEHKDDIESVLERVFGKPVACMLEFQDTSNLERIEQLLAHTRRATASTILPTDSYYLAALGENIVRNDIHDEVQRRLDDLEIDARTKTLAQLRISLHTGKLAEARRLLPLIDVQNLSTYAELCDVASVLYLTRRYEDARLAFARAEKLKPLGARAMAGRGLCYWQKKEWIRAIEPLRKSLQIDPNQFLARYALGQSLYQLGRKSESLRQLRAAGIINPNSSLPGLFVTAAYLKDNDLELATANQHLIMRKKPLAPDAIALGIVVDALDGRGDLSENLRKRYREITTRDITIADARKLVDKILSEPYVLWN
ncbi:fused MFS/spermidine synthase [Candidatus Obscuribacterales bacterium]|nr:fused MFS/spermidine synthase [Candidatus Obscuribacterales bacterium]